MVMWVIEATLNNKKTRLKDLINGYIREEEKRSNVPASWPLAISYVCLDFYAQPFEVYFKQKIKFIHSKLHRDGQAICMPTQNHRGFKFAVQIAKWAGWSGDWLHFAVDVKDIPADLPRYYDLKWDASGFVKKCAWRYSIEFIHLNVWMHHRYGWITKEDEAVNLMTLQQKSALALPVKVVKGMEDWDVRAVFDVRRLHPNCAWNYGVKMKAQTFMEWDLTTVATDYPEIVTIGKKNMLCPVPAIHSALSDDRCWFIVLNAEKGQISINWFNRPSAKLAKVGVVIWIHVHWRCGDVDTKEIAVVLPYKPQEEIFNALIDPWGPRPWEDLMVDHLAIGKVIQKIKVNIYVESVFKIKNMKAKKYGVREYETVDRKIWEELGVELQLNMLKDNE